MNLLLNWKESASSMQNLRPKFRDYALTNWMETKKKTNYNPFFFHEISSLRKNKLYGKQNLNFAQNYL